MIDIALTGESRTKSEINSMLEGKQGTVFDCSCPPHGQLRITLEGTASLTRC